MKTNVQSLEIKVREMALFDQRWPFVNPSRVYFAYFEFIPSYIIISGIDNLKAMSWIRKTQSDNILKTHTRRFQSNSTGKMEISHIIYILKDQLLIKIENNGFITILYSEESEVLAETLACKIKDLKKAYSSQFSMFIESGDGLKLFDIKSMKPKLSIIGNYNNDLNDLHTKILIDLKKKDNSGLYLFHGAPGTGKSTYIRYLIHYLNKRIIFLPPKLAGSLDSPKFLNFLVDQPNSVLIIEDAEDLLTSRENGNVSSISMLLNLTDGMLGESLGIQVICTFNAPLVNIDKALLRKGRLKVLYEFKPLSIMKSIALLKKLGVNDRIINEPMTIADIYNIRENKFELKTSKKVIGFSHST